MFDLFIAFAAAAGVQAAAAPATQAPTLAAIPGVTVNYYDVSGRNIEQIRESMASTRPEGADGNPIPAATSWQVEATLSTRTENGQCAIAGVTPKFSGTAELPRLTTSDKLKPEVLQQWNAFVASLESAAAAQLDFIHDRLPQVQQAVASAKCDTASAALDSAIEQLKAQEAAFVAEQAAQRAAAERQAAAQQKAAQEQRDNPSWDPKKD